MKNKLAKYTLMTIITISAIVGMNYATQEKKPKTAYDYMAETLTKDCLENKAYN